MHSVLISGIGISGPALAYWLRRSGFEVMLIDHAPALRTSGYMIDFWGAGFDIAEKMGLLPQILAHGYRIDELRLVDAQGRRTAGFDVHRIRTLLRDRFISLLRGDLSKLLFESIDDVETSFGDSIRHIAPSGNKLHVEFARASPRDFDLVIGADGLHSAVRKLWFGDEREFARHLGYYAASFSVENYPCRDPAAYVGFTAPGRQVARYALRGGRTVFFFIFAAPAEHVHEPRDRKKLLHETYAGQGWECPQILRLLDGVDDLYFDDVSQIRMPRWSRGRVALVGDACACPSLLAGQGASLGMLGGYVLAGELKRSAGDFDQAFARYEERLKALITAKQDEALKFGSWFAPRTRLGIFARDQITRLMQIPFVANHLLGVMLRDDVQLPRLDA
jgi:2-polyprenyl-6-methoxyphenol hydroxylase-like FAD-dependent oxidoreductase